MQALLADTVMHPLSLDAARHAGFMHGQLIKQGKMIGAIDCMIAAIALEHRKPVLTRNIKDFSKIEGLKVLTY